MSRNQILCQSLATARHDNCGIVVKRFRSYRCTVHYHLHQNIFVRQCTHSWSSRSPRGKAYGRIGQYKLFPRRNRCIRTLIRCSLNSVSSCFRSQPLDSWGLNKLQNKTSRHQSLDIVPGLLGSQRLCRTTEKLDTRLGYNFPSKKSRSLLRTIPGQAGSPRQCCTWGPRS